MTIYLVNIFLILLWGFGLIYYHPTPKKKMYFCAIASLQWTLISGLRHVSVGADTEGYLRTFQAVGKRSWKTVLQAFFDVYFRGREPMNSEENSLYKDTGYLVFQKFVHIFTDNQQVYLLIVAAIIFAALAYFIYKNSEDPVFSYVLFSILFYGFFAVTGIRQALATALAVFVGYEFIKENKFWKFAVVALIAFTLHKSVLVFILFYWLSKIKVSWKYIAALAAVLLVGFAGGPSFILQIAELFGYTRDDVYEANTVAYTTVIAIIGLGFVFLFKWIQKQGSYKNAEINAILLAVVLTFFTLIDQTMMRVQQYYALFLMLGIPSALCCFQKRERVLLKSIAYLAMVAYLFSNHPQYRFFWQS